MWRGAALTVLAAVAGVAMVWEITSRLEAENAFCVSCHLGDAPLHDRKANDFEATPAINLAAAHRVADPEFRCIACHGGASLLNRLRVKAVSGGDTLRYLFGCFEEPTAMRHPLWDEDCTQCHSSYAPRRSDAFHAYSAHNTRLGYGCVECHRAHPTGAGADLGFLEPEVVLPVCGHCHEEFQR